MSLNSGETSAKRGAAWWEDARARLAAVDRSLAPLLMLEYVAASLAAGLSGADALLEVAAAGALVTLPPLALSWRTPGAAATRWAIALGQLAWCALLIALWGWRPGALAAICGALAVAALYRDLRLLAASTTLAVAGPALLSLTGAAAIPLAEALEGGAWIAACATALAISARNSARDQLLLDRHRVDVQGFERALGELTVSMEERVAVRTRALKQARDRSNQMLAELERTQEEKLALSRAAGMAEVATGVLHNVGNALNSIRVSSEQISEQIARMRIDGLSRVVGLLEQQGALTDPRIKLLLGKLCESLAGDRDRVVEELKRLREGLDHTATLVSRQQSNARKVTIAEERSLRQVLEEALTLSALRGGVEVQLQVADDGPVALDRHRVVEILVNLIRNAAQATARAEHPGRLVLGARREASGMLAFSVQDNGVGLSEADQAKLFQLGFTTKADGHGFGLHACANLAGEIGGRITCSSAGPGLGACFTLKIPAARADRRVA